MSFLFSEFSEKHMKILKNFAFISLFIYIDNFQKKNLKILKKIAFISLFK